MKTYLSGPISNPDPVIQRANLDRMNAKAEELRAQGEEVFNPAELEEKNLQSWEFYLIRDLFWIFENKPEKFYFMKGWETSRGALLEHECAKYTNVVCEYE